MVSLWLILGTNNIAPHSFDMSGVNDALPLDGKKKSAEMFLGANANLVNLENLVSKPAGAGANPFGMPPNSAPAPNPFGANQPQRMPMNQMGNISTMGFTPTNNGVVMPSPLVAPPMAGQPLPMVAPMSMAPMPMGMPMGPPMAVPYAMPQPMGAPMATNMMPQSNNPFL
jgi:hypothetical protein